MKEILNRLIKYKTLNEVESKDILIKISNGELNNSQISSFLTVYMILSDSHRFIIAYMIL